MEMELSEGEGNCPRGEEGLEEEKELSGMEVEVARCCTAGMPLGANHKKSTTGENVCIS